MVSSKSLKSTSDNLLFFSVNVTALLFFLLTNVVTLAKVDLSTLASVTCF